MIRLFQVKCANENEIEAQILKKLRIRKEDLLQWHVHRKSVDARHQKVLFSYVVDCKVKNEKKLLKLKDVSLTPDETYHPVMSGKHALLARPVVVGFGPAGMFAALILAQSGYKPIVLERGSKVDVRKQKVETFWENGQLDEECNVQFGEGGAGAFSDGKLTTRSKDSLCRKVLEELVSFGAKPDILIDQHPHIGTDAFLAIIRNCREEIERLGGTFYFDTKLEDIKVENGTLKQIYFNQQWVDCNALILATGHSASDTILMLHQHGIHVENKPFAVGVRIEHKQKYINEAMLHEYSQDERLIPARYQLTYTASNSKGVYTFCMCPGGTVIASASEEGEVVTNGMSEHARDKENANSAFLVNVKPSDFGSDHPLAGVEFQRKYERLAFELGGGNYNAPVQLVGDFLQDKVTTELGKVKPSYKPGYKFADLRECLPDFVCETMKEALPKLDNKLKGFAMHDAVLTGVETRSSAPIRIVRDEETLESVSLEKLYPCGEGAGYAGGIVTAAVDGIKCAEKIIENYSKIQ